MRLRGATYDPRRPYMAFGGIFVILAAMLLALLLPFHTVHAEGSVVINEISPLRIGTDREWVELYNPTDKPIDMSGWRIKHGSLNFSKVFDEGTVIHAKSFLVRSATSDNSQLNDNSATLTLMKNDTAVVDTVTYEKTAVDTTYARERDGSGVWKINATPTKASWNELDAEKPVVRDVVIRSPDRWEDRNLYGDNFFKDGDGWTAGGRLSFSATLTDNQALTAGDITLTDMSGNAVPIEVSRERESSTTLKVRAEWNSAATNGTYTLTFSAKDDGTLKGAPIKNEEKLTIRLNIDNTAPQVTGLSFGRPETGGYYMGDVKLDITLDDQHIAALQSGIQRAGTEATRWVCQDREERSCAIDSRQFGDGNYVPAAFVKDIAGNTTTRYGAAVAFNNDAPTVPEIGALRSGTVVNGTGTVLDWTDAADGNGPVTYRFEWSTTSDMAGVVEAESKNGLTVSETALPAERPDGTYLWRVQACDAFQKCGAWSDIWSVVIDTTGPSLTMNTPVRNADGTYTVTGTTDETSSVFGYLDGQVVPTEVVPVNGMWTYTTETPLILGDHTLTVTSQDSVGNEGTATTAFSAELPPVVTVIARPRVLASVSQSPAAVVAATSPTVPVAVQDIIEASAEVLGADATSNDAAPVEATSRGWLLLGVEWYWWAAGLGIIGLIAWWMVRLRNGAVAP